MKAAYIERTGAPDTIIWGKLPKPKPTGSQVLVKVGAVALNPVDTYIRAGLVPMELPSQFIVGCDLAGTVEAVGPEVQRFQPGDRVWGSNQGLLGRQGTFAEYAAVDECWLYHTPEEIDDQQAAAIALVGITAHLGLFREAQVQPGEKVFVHGGSGGVGSCVVQMARAAGARVITTASSAEKVRICRDLGAHAVVNYRRSEVNSAVWRFAPDGVDVWFETLREQNFERTIELMALRGRIIVMAGRDSRPRLPVGPFYMKDCKMFGFAMFNAPADLQRKCAAEINRWMARGRLRPLIDRVMPLEKAAEAHWLQEQSTLGRSGTLSGKIVLVP